MNALFTPPQQVDAKPLRRTAMALYCAMLAMAALLAGCSSARPWLNAPLPVAQRAAPERQALLQSVAARDPSLLVAVTLSGGGARAAAFGFGVLSAMQETRFHWMTQAGQQGVKT